MQDKQSLRFLLLGPAKSGKTRIANYLADFEKNPNLETYNPTMALRVLEFDAHTQNKNHRNLTLPLQVFDTSGNRKYENCWPAMLKSADPSGAILVYDPCDRSQEKDIELWYKSFLQPLNFNDAQFLVLAHQKDPVGKRNFQVPKALDKFAFAVSGIDNEDGAAALRSAFSDFVRGAYQAIAEKSSAELEASMQDASR